MPPGDVTVSQCLDCSRLTPPGKSKRHLCSRCYQSRNNRGAPLPPLVDRSTIQRPDRGVCSVDACVRPVARLGGEMCRPHEKRVANHGTTATLCMNFDERASQAVRAASGCLLWQGAMNNHGYGNTTRGASGHSQASGVHRVAWERHHGRAVPDGYDVGHTCHDKDETCPGGRGCQHRACFDVSHLELQTRGVNLAASGSRGSAARQRARTHCRRGHEYTPENTRHDRGRGGARVCRTCNIENGRRFRDTIS